MNIRVIAFSLLTALAFLSASAADKQAPVETEIWLLGIRLQQKLNSGPQTEESMAPELEAIDTLVAKHADDAESASKVLAMKAMLYVKVFKDASKAAAVLAEIKEKYPNTKMGGEIADFLKQGAKFPQMQASPAESEISELADSIQSKVVKGARTEADLSAELEEIDNLVKKHTGSDDEAAADLLLLKLKIYVQTVRDQAKAAAIVDEINAKFPHTRAAAGLKKELEIQKRAQEAKALNEKLVIGGTIPAFDVPDISGQSLSLNSQNGRVILLSFWSANSVDCVQDLPKILAAYKKYHDQGFDVIGINVDTKRAEFDSISKEFKIPWPQYFDGLGSQGVLARLFGITQVPMIFLVDKQGKILARDLRGRAIDQAVAAALSTPVPAQ